MRDNAVHGPIRLLRSSSLGGLRNVGSIYEWVDQSAYVAIEKVRFRQSQGAILVYNNPPVHQVATPALHALLDGMDAVLEESHRLEYLILYDSNDPLHAGGDLKESLNHLQQSLKRKRQMESTNASPEEIDHLFSWGEARLQKGVSLYRKIREMAKAVRVVAVCGGGMRFGGSAEIPLMADVLIGDERGGMCFSESMIGIIPGWAGIARVLVKAGVQNAEIMAKTAREIHAWELKKIGVYNDVVRVPFPLPGLRKIGGAGPEQERILQDRFDRHDDRTGEILLPKALEYATCPPEKIPLNRGRGVLAEKGEVDREVQERADPYSYSHIWNRPLGEVTEEIRRLGRPLAPQSISALDGLLQGVEPSVFNEERFVWEELNADAALYRDPRFLEGLQAVLDRRVPDFRDPSAKEDERWVCGGGGISAERKKHCG